MDDEEERKEIMTKTKKSKKEGTASSAAAGVGVRAASIVTKKVSYEDGNTENGLST